VRLVYSQLNIRYAMRKLMSVAGMAVALCCASTNLQAQERQERQDRPDRGNFDPEQMRQRMMERYREQLEIKNDDEW
jgi:hypothetical protein